MQITRNILETASGPSDWFTGTVLIDTVAGSRSTASGSRTAASPRAARLVPGVW